MKVGSLFDGIGGWILAAVRHGITPAWSSEIEAFPVSVTRRHFPELKHLGDITKINGAEIEPVDIICMGSPCQDLSIAGKREGLDGARSGLFSSAINIIRDMRTATNSKYPRFVVWENVPGAFSSNGGLDFKTVLEEITEAEIPMPASDRWANAGMVRSDRVDIAWRVLDAQYWGVPQRRKRIFLVADFAGQCAGEILFKPESLRGNIAQGRETRESTAGSFTDGARETSLGFDTKDSIANSMPVLIDKTPPIKTNNRLGVLAFKQGQGAKAGTLGLAADISPTLTAAQSGTNMVPVIYDMTHADEVMREVKGGIVQTLNARMGTGGNQVPVIHIAIPINDKATRCKGGGDTRNNDGAGNGFGVGQPGDPAPTLTAADRHAVYTIQSFSEYKDCDVASTLKQRDYKGPTDLVVCKPNAIAYSFDSLSSNSMLSKNSDSGCRAVDIARCIDTTYPDPSKNQGGIAILSCDKGVNDIVRRLTPTECERLQGLPDGWTDGGSDTARYKAIGNGMAQCCADYIMQNIAEVERQCQNQSKTQ